MGTAYAIPTKDANLLALPVDRIRGYVEAFLVYAAQSPDLKFRVIAIGNWARRLWPRGDRTYVRQRAK
jgi:hypothetical protein